MVHRAPPVPPVLRSGTLGNSPSDNLQNTPHFGNSSRKTATSRTAVHVACRLLSKGGKRDRGLAPCSRPLSPACESCAAAPRHVAIMAPAHSTPQVETIKQYSGMVTVQRRVKDFPAASGGGAAGGLSGRGDRVRSTPQVLCPPQGLAAVAEMSFSCHFP